MDWDNSFMSNLNYETSYYLLGLSVLLYLFCYS